MMAGAVLGDCAIMVCCTRMRQGARASPHGGWTRVPYDPQAMRACDASGAPWARGATVGVLGMGVPRPAFPRPRTSALHRPKTNRPGTTHGKALARARASRGGGAPRHAGGLLRIPPEQRRFQGKTRPHESRMTRGKDRRATDCRMVEFPLSCKGGKDVHKFPRNLPKVSFLVQQGCRRPPEGQTSSLDPSLQRWHPLCRRRPPSRRGRMFPCSPSKLAVVGSFTALAIREEDPDRRYI